MVIQVQQQLMLRYVQMEQIQMEMTLITVGAVRMMILQQTLMVTVVQAGMAQMAGAAEQAGGQMGLAGPGAPPEGEGEAPPEEGGGELPPGTPEEEAAEGEEVAKEEGGEETNLVAAPGKRDEEDWYKTDKKDVFGKTKASTTSKSKGKWYKPVSYDKRDMGARRRHYKGQWADEVGSSTQRNLHKGALELFGLGKNAIYEEMKLIMKSRNVQY